MRRIVKGRRPSAALIIASLALIFALGGTAVAVVGLSSKEKKQVKKIAKKQIKKRAPGLSVANAARLGGVGSNQYLTFDSTLRSGKTETGVFAVAGGSSTTGMSIFSIGAGAPVYGTATDGASVFWTITGGGSYAAGHWAVTAP
jgi:hypothetical protein